MTQPFKAALSIDQREVAAEHISAIKRTCRGPLSAAAREEISAALAEGDAEKAKQLDAANREHCGEDLNAVILAGDWDGQSHEAACPKCKNDFTYTAPMFGPDFFTQE